MFSVSMKQDVLNYHLISPLVVPSTSLLLTRQSFEPYHKHFPVQACQVCAKETIFFCILRGNDFLNLVDHCPSCMFPW